MLSFGLFIFWQSIDPQKIWEIENRQRRWFFCPGSHNIVLSSMNHSHMLQTRNMSRQRRPPQRRRTGMADGFKSCAGIYNQRVIAVACSIFLSVVSGKRREMRSLSKAVVSGVVQVFVALKFDVDDTDKWYILQECFKYGLDDGTPRRVLVIFGLTVSMREGHVWNLR